MGSLLKGGSMDKLSSNSGQFDPTNWQTIARMHLRTRYEDFPEEDIEIVGGYMGDVSMPPPPGAIYLCETDSMDQGIAEVTERFSLAVEGSKPWTFLLYSTSEYDSGRLVARVLWHHLDPIRAGLKLWTAYLKWRSPRFICPYETRAGEYWLEDEVAAAIAEIEAWWKWVFHPEQFPDRYAPFGAAWLPLLDASANLPDDLQYQAPVILEALPGGLEQIGTVLEPNAKDLSKYYLQSSNEGLILVREYIFRQPRGSNDLLLPYDKNYSATAKIDISAADDAHLMGALLFLKCRCEGRVKEIEYPKDLKASALTWILENEEAMASCRSLVRKSNE